MGELDQFQKHDSRTFEANCISHDFRYPSARSNATDDSSVFPTSSPYLRSVDDRFLAAVSLVECSSYTSNLNL
jgi:hypothetical protein